MADVTLMRAKSHTQHQLVLRLERLGKSQLEQAQPVEEALPGRQFYDQRAEKAEHC